MVFSSGTGTTSSTLQHECKISHAEVSKSTFKEHATTQHLNKDFGPRAWELNMSQSSKQASGYKIVRIRELVEALQIRHLSLGAKKAHEQIVL